MRRSPWGLTDERVAPPERPRAPVRRVRELRRATGEPPGSGGPAQSREILDAAVRCLALGTGGIRGRVEMAARSAARTFP